MIRWYITLQGYITFRIPKLRKGSLFFWLWNRTPAVGLCLALPAARQTLKLSFILIKNNFRCLAEVAKCAEHGGRNARKSFNCWRPLDAPVIIASASAYDEHFPHVTRFTQLPLHALYSPFVLNDNCGGIFKRGSWVKRESVTHTRQLFDLTHMLKSWHWVAFN